MAKARKAKSEVIKRRAAALKAWETRAAHKKAKEELAKKRSAAAYKAWDTRRKMAAEKDPVGPIKKS